MKYIDSLAGEIQRVADPDSTPPDDDLPLYRLYSLLALVKGAGVTAEDVHNAWAVWASDHDRDSPFLIPFKELSLSVQRKDDRYVDAIKQVVAQLHLDNEERS